MKWRLATLLAVLCFSLSAAFAQTPPAPATASAPSSVVGGYVQLNATTASSRVALPSTYNVLTVYNSGTADGWIRTGSSTVVAAAASPSIKIKAGTAFCLWVGSAADIAGITASGSTTIDVWQGNGCIAFSGGAGAGGAGGGGGAITAAAGSYAAGAFSSGAFASGAFSSGSYPAGAFSSGSFAAGAFASGAQVDLGTQADAACGSDVATCSMIANQKRTNLRLTDLYGALVGPIPAQTGHGALIGATEGQTAPGVTPTENPQYNGGLARTTNPAPVGDNTKVWDLKDAVGKTVTSPYAIRESWRYCSVDITTTTATTCTGMGAQGAGVKLYIVAMQCSRRDTGTTPALMTANDSVNSQFLLPASNGNGWANQPYLPIPLVIAANTPFQLTSDTLITSGLHCNAQAFIGY